MADVLIPLAGIGTLRLSREQYEAALVPINPPAPAPSPAPPGLVDAGTLARVLALPKSTVYELAKGGRIPCVRAGKHVRFDVDAVTNCLRISGARARP
ncbi:MAG: excisionase family DNA-binding protein [Gammaproteobacteria bacterium]|nr:excisionase family DNA-binding protein [Gammaproteobacteria bacterium]